MFYSAVLSIHSILRWLVVLFGLYAIFRSFIGWMTQSDWTPKDNRISLIYTIILDAQLLVGIILYFFASPLTSTVFGKWNEITDPVVKFFSINHIVMMVVAVALAHIGRFLSSRLSYGIGPHKHAATWFSLSFLFILVSIPWPFMPVARPWLTFFGLTF
jgi:hypothetical protein